MVEPRSCPVLIRQARKIFRACLIRAGHETTPFGAKICPLSGIGKCPFRVANVLQLWYFRNTASVCCSVGVRFSEGPLWEVPIQWKPSNQDTLR